MKAILRFCKHVVAFFVYPVYVPVKECRRPDATPKSKVAVTFFAIFILLPIWLAAYGFSFFSGRIVLQYTGHIRTDVPVQGASMLPTLEEQGDLPAHHYPAYEELQRVSALRPHVERLKPKIEHQDIVVFQNTETEHVFYESEEEAPADGKRGGFVKRVIGLPGDTVYIRDGFVVVNEERLNEPYILKPRSTFGGDAIHDCQPVTVPEGKLLVLGDNRKVSLDSREIGLVSYDDIKFYLPFEEQKGLYGTRWRNTAGDFTHELDSTLDAEAFVALLNQKRTASGVEELKYVDKLSESAKRRAEVMLEYDDLSYEATRSGYTMRDALDEVGYSNIIIGEFPVLGYYNAEELIESFFEYSDSRDFLLNPDYEEIGLSTFVGDLNNCPVQIVVQHLAGYKPPNYEQAEIDQWRNLVADLEDIRPGWIELASTEVFYNDNKAVVDEINEIIRTRLRRARAILERMEANEWFTEEEERYIEEDRELFGEQSRLANEINQLISSYNEE